MYPVVVAPVYIVVHSGDTIKVDKNVYKLNLLPSGIIRNNTLSIIGNGVVVNPLALLEEIKKLNKVGIKVSKKNLKISENASIIFSFHKRMSITLLFNLSRK